MSEEILPDCGASGTYDWKTALWKFSVPYVVQTIAEVHSFVPTFFPLGCPCTNRQCHQRNDGTWDLVLTHEGMPDTPGQSDTAELDFMTAEEPIEQFGKFDALYKKYSGQMDPDGVRFNGWKNPITIDGKKQHNPLFGTSHFLSPAPIWRLTMTRKTFPASLLHTLGKIDTPQGSGTAQPPELADGNNWVRRAVRASFKGNAWTIVVEWQGGGQGGWVTDIYGTSVSNSVR